MKEAPEAGESAQMQQLVQSVNKNIADIVSALDQVDKQQGGPSAQTKKLRNDVKKEEVRLWTSCSVLKIHASILILFVMAGCD